MSSFWLSLGATLFVMNALLYTRSRSIVQAVLAAIGAAMVTIVVFGGVGA